MVIHGLLLESKSAQITRQPLFSTCSCVRQWSMVPLTMFEATTELRTCQLLIIWKASVALGAIFGASKSCPWYTSMVFGILITLTNSGVFTIHRSNAYGLKSPRTLDQSGGSSSTSLRKSVGWTLMSLGICGSYTTSFSMRSMKTLISGHKCGMNTSFRSEVNAGGPPGISFFLACCKMDHEVWSWIPLTVLHVKGKVLWCWRAHSLPSVQISPRLT